jgi:EmrB/QacA subfamily drug resistance transporter
MGQRRHSLLLAVCCTAQFMVILDIAIVNVALPSIESSLGFSKIDLQWIVNAYTIAFAGFLMLGGRAADLFGQRRTFIAGLLVFAAASVAGGTASSQGMLVGARAVQGLGGAIMAPASLSIITSAFAAGPERMRAVGLWGAMNGAGGATGVLLGGIITQELSWRWILLINLPIGIGAALVARVAVDERRREGPAASFDLAGALTVTLGLVALVYGIVSAGVHGWGSAAALAPIALGVVLLALFLLIEAKLAAAPLMPLRAFSNRLLRVSNLVVLVFSAALFPMWYFVSLYLQEVLRFHPLGAGLAFLPMSLTIMACATHAGRLVARFGAGPVLGGGLTLMALGMALFARIEVNGGYVSDVMLPGLLVATGIGFSVVPSTIAATATATPSEAGLASGLVNTSRQIGGALGLAILTSLAALYTSHLTNVDFRAPILALNDGFRLAFLIGAGFAAVGALMSFRLIPRMVLPAGAAPAPPPGAAAGPDRAATGDSLATPPAPAILSKRGHVQGATARARAPGNGNAARASLPGPVEPDRPSAPDALDRRAGGGAGDPAASSIATVAFSVAGGGSWPWSTGSMTIRLAGEERSRWTS